MNKTTDLFEMNTINRIYRITSSVVERYDAISKIDFMSECKNHPSFLSGDSGRILKVYKDVYEAV